MEHPIAPMVIRGRVITDDLVLMGGRGGDLSFLAPDPHRYIGQLPLGNPTRLEDLYRLTFDDILDYAGELAQKLDFKTNAHMQRACEISYLTAPSTPSIVKATYLALPQMLERKAIIEADGHDGRHQVSGRLGQAEADRRRPSWKYAASVRARCTSSPATRPGCRC